MDVSCHMSNDAIRMLCVVIFTLAIVAGLLKYMDTFWD